MGVLSCKPGPRPSFGSHVSLLSSPSSKASKSCPPLPALTTPQPTAVTFSAPVESEGCYALGLACCGEGVGDRSLGNITCGQLSAALLARIAVALLQ